MIYLQSINTGLGKKLSTVSTIYSIYDRLIKNIDNDLYACGLFLDLAKAFDAVDHA